MPLENYEIARKHWQQWASNPDLSDDERKKYLLPEVPKHSAFLKTKFELLETSLGGLITQQEAARQYRANITTSQKRDVIHLETHKDAAWLLNHPRFEEKRTAKKLHLEQTLIETQANADEFSALRLLKMDDAIKKEINRKEEENKTVANEVAKGIIEKEIAELNAFLARLPEMRAAIQAFTEQQILQQLSASSIARAAMDEAVPLGASSDGKINEGHVLTEKQKKDSETSYIRVSGKLSSHMIKLTVEEKDDGKGNKNIDFSISSESFEMGKWGPGAGYLYHEGRMDLAEHIHERLRGAMKEDFGMDFLALAPKNVRWFMQYLTDSIEVSLASARKQSELSRVNPNSPPFSSHVIMHDTAIASLDDWADKNPWSAWIYRDEILSIKLYNNKCNIEKAHLLMAETRYARQNAADYSPASPLVVTEKMTTALQLLAIASRNTIALTLKNIKLTSDNFNEATQALESLQDTQRLVQAEYETVFAGYQQMQIQLEQVKAIRPQNTKKITALETKVQKLKHDMQELAMALRETEVLIQRYHDKFFTNDAGLINKMTHALGNKDETIRALASVIAMFPQSLDELADILVAADKATYPDRAAVLRAFEPPATATQKVAMINRAYDFNATGTMAVLKEVYETVKEPPQDLAKLSAIILSNRSSVVASFVVNADPGGAAGLAQKNLPLTADKILKDDVSSQQVILRNETYNAVCADTILTGKIAKIDLSRTAIAIRNDRTSVLKVMLRRETYLAVRDNDNLAVKVAQLNFDNTVEVIHSKSEESRSIGIQAANTVLSNSALTKKIVLSDVKRAASIIVHDNESVADIIKSDNESKETIAKILAGPETFKAKGRNYTETYAKKLKDARNKVNNDLMTAIAEARAMQGGIDELRSMIVLTLNRDAIAFSRINKPEVCKAVIQAALEDWVNLDSNIQLQVIKLMLGFDLDNSNAAPDPVRFREGFKHANENTRLTIIETALNNWERVTPEICLEIITLLLNNPATFAAALAAATEATRLDIIKVALNDWANPVFTPAIRLEIITHLLNNPATFTLAFQSATESTKVAIIEEILANPHVFHGLDDTIKQKIISFITAAHPELYNTDQFFFSADPIVISANATIDALAPVVAGNKEIRNLLVDILADAIVAETPGMQRIYAINRANDKIKANPAAALREGLVHDLAAGKVVLSKAKKAANKTSQDTAALIIAVPTAFKALVEVDPAKMAAEIFANPESKSLISEYLVRKRIAAGENLVNATVHADQAINNTPNDAFKEVTDWLLTTPTSYESFKNAASPQVQAINRAGLTFNEVRGDGSCFYYAIATSQAGRVLTESDQGVANLALRKQVADRIEADQALYNADPTTGIDYVGFYEAEHTANPTQYPWPTFADYMVAVRDGSAAGAYADNFTIPALGKVLGRPIYVIDQDGNFRVNGTEEAEVGEPLFVYYDGNNHYDALVNDAAVPRQEIAARLKLQQSISQNVGIQSAVANVIEKNPSDATGKPIRQVVDSVRKIPNPDHVEEAFTRDAEVKALLNSSAKDCADGVREVRGTIKWDDKILSLEDAKKQTDAAAMQVNPGASIAARNMVIGALTQVVNEPTTTGPLNEANELARVAIIQQMDFDVLAELVVKGDNAFKDTIAACIPLKVAPQTPATLAEARAMLNEPVQAQKVLKAALSNPNALLRRAAGNAIRDVLAKDSLPHLAMERALGANPFAVFASTRARHNRVMATAITAEVGKLTAKEIKEIAKVDLAVCGALIVNIMDPGDPRLKSIAA
ncbi:MAG: OTU domain-containing protein, partial [Pseudomonadota bacterium]